MKRFDLFGIGGNLVAYHKAWNGTAYDLGITGWTRHYVDASSEPTVVSWTSNQVDLFGLMTDGGIVDQAWDGPGWAPGIAGADYLGGPFITFA